MPHKWAIEAKNPVWTEVEQTGNVEERGLVKMPPTWFLEEMKRVVKGPVSA